MAGSTVAARFRPGVRNMAVRQTLGNPAGLFGIGYGKELKVTKRAETVGMRDGAGRLPPWAAALLPPVRLPRRLAALWRCRRGVTALEFAFVGPVLLMILLGIFWVGLAINNYSIITNAAEQGAQSLALSRGTTSPYSTALAAIDAAAVTLNTSNLTVTMTVGGTACTSTSCTVATAGAVAQVTVAYPCNLVIYNKNYGGSPCSLTVTAANVVQ